MMHEPQLKDGTSYNNKAASIGTNVDSISTNINNMSITNTEDSVPKGAGRDKEAEITSNKKVSTSCAQNSANHTMGRAYWKGEVVEKDQNKAIQHLKLAAIGGYEKARHCLGDAEMCNGNIDRAMKHYMIAAKSGYDNSLKLVGAGYKAGHVTKDEYAITLRAYQNTQDKMKSEQRTKAVDKIIYPEWHKVKNSK